MQKLKADFQIIFRINWSLFLLVPSFILFFWVILNAFVQRLNIVQCRKILFWGKANFSRIAEIDFWMTYAYHSAIFLWNYMVTVFNSIACVIFHVGDPLHECLMLNVCGKEKPFAKARYSKSSQNASRN